MPRLEGPYLFGTHHSKMALLWYRDGVRVMVATGNYIEIGERASVLCLSYGSR